jgi:hypothetical protein
MITIGDALLKLGVDKTDLEKGMSEAERSVQVSLKSIQQGLMAAGAAFTAVGVAGMKMVSDAKKMNAELGQTALTLGVSTKEMRNLALATTDVTFPLKSVADTFELLARAGVTSTEEMQNAAKAFDGLADATGSSAEAMADLLLPAFKLFGEEIPQTTEELDKFTWMTKKTLVDVSDFGTLLTRMAPYMDDLDMSMEDAIATLAALGDQGITGTAATLKLRTAITQAASSGEDLNTVLGITKDEINEYKKQMSEATGITEKYAEVANSQYTILDKVKQKLSEFSVSVGSAIEPLEGMFGAMSALGPAMIGISMALPKLISIFKSMPIVFHSIKLAATSMWGAITLGVSLAIAAGIALWQNWDKVSKFLVSAWDKIKLAFAYAIKFIVNTVLLPFIEYWGKLIGGVTLGIGKLVGIFNKELGATIEGISQKLINARSEISDWADNLIEADKIKQNAVKVEQSVQDMTKTIKAELEKQKQSTKDYYATQKELAKKSTDDQKAEILKQTEEKKRATEVAVSLLEKEYDAKIRTLNAERDAQLSALQEQIDDIDRQTEQEDLALTRAAERKRLTELVSAIDSAKTDEERAQAIKEHAEYVTQVERNELLRQRDAEKDALRQQMDEVRAAAEAEEDRLKKEVDARIAEWQRALDEFLELEQIKSDNLDIALANELERLAKEEEALVMSFDARLTEAALYQAALEATLKDVSQTVTTHYVSDYSSTGTSSGSKTGASTSPTWKVVKVTGGNIAPYAHGGLITEPTLLSSMKTGIPYAIAGEAGTERVSPMQNQMMTIIWEQDGKQVARNIMPYVVGEIRLRTGVRI